MSKWRQIAWHTTECWIDFRFGWSITLIAVGDCFGSDRNESMQVISMTNKFKDRNRAICLLNFQETNNQHFRKITDISDRYCVRNCKFPARRCIQEIHWVCTHTTVPLCNQWKCIMIVFRTCRPYIMGQLQEMDIPQSPDIRPMLTQDNHLKSRR